MHNYTINRLPEGFRELPMYFHTVSSSFRQNTKRYEPGEQDFYQLLFVVSGTGILHCNGNTYPLARGSAFFTAMGHPSEYIDTGTLTTAFLTVKGPAIPDLLAHYGCGSFLFAGHVNLEKNLSGIQQIIREYYENKREGLLSALAYSFFVDFFEQQANAPMSPLEQTCLYIERNFTQKLTLDHLAAVSGVSVSKLCHDFRKHLGCSAVEYILDLRLTYARSFLQTSREARTKDAALSCGFEDVSYFCKAYKKKFGRTPAQDRDPAQEEQRVEIEA